MTEEATFNLNVEGADKALSEIRQLTNALKTTKLSLSDVYLILDQLNLPRNTQNALNVLKQVLAIVQSLRVAAKSLMVESGPAGLVVLGLMVAAQTGIDFANAGQRLEREYRSRRWDF